MNSNLETLFSKCYSLDKVGPSPAYYLESRPDALKHFLTLYKIKSLFDAGCRNRDWISMIDFKQLDIEYTGGDISSDMVNYCNKHYPGYKITLYDCTTDTIPEVDCVLISDVLIHLSNIDKIKFLKQFIFSNSKMLLMTYSNCSVNEEISLTGPHNDFPFAPVNWKLAPWYFPDPVYDMFSQHLGLWTRDQIKKIVDNL